MIIGRLRSDDIYFQQAAYPLPEHRYIGFSHFIDLRRGIPFIDSFLCLSCWMFVFVCVVVVGQFCCSVLTSANALCDSLFHALHFEGFLSLLTFLSFPFLFLSFCASDVLCLEHI